MPRRWRLPPPPLQQTMKTDEETVFAFVVDYCDKFCSASCANLTLNAKCGVVRKNAQCQFLFNWLGFISSILTRALNTVNNKVKNEKKLTHFTMRWNRCEFDFYFQKQTLNYVFKIVKTSFETRCVNFGKNEFNGNVCLASIFKFFKDSI